MDTDRTGSIHGVSSSSAVSQLPMIESPKGEYNNEHLEEINIL